MVIICGHTRLLAAKKLGLDVVPVHVADNLTPEQVQAYRIADNRTVEIAEWDYSLLNAFTETIKKYTPGRVDTSYRQLTSCFGLDGHRPALWS